MGCATGTIKFAIFSLNFVLVLIGFGMVLYGALDTSLPSELDHFDEMVKQMSITSKALIVFGSIVFLVAFFGCWGAVTDSSCMLFLYAMFLIVLVFLEATVVIYGYVHRDSVKDEASRLLKQWIAEYNVQGQATKDIVDGIQLKLRCCGVDGPHDWDNKSINNGFFQREASPPPNSCCGKSDQDPQCSPQNIYRTGCLQKGMERIAEKVQQYTWIVGLVLAIEMFTILASLMVYNAIKNEERRQGYA